MNEARQRIAIAMYHLCLDKADAAGRLTERYFDWVGLAARFWNMMERV